MGLEEQQYIPFKMLCTAEHDVFQRVNVSEVQGRATQPPQAESFLANSNYLTEHATEKQTFTKQGRYDFCVLLNSRFWSAENIFRVLLAH